MSKRTKQLRRANDAAAQQLPQSAHCALLQITEHLHDVRVSSYERECIRSDVIQMLSDAAARGDTPTDVLGEDYRAFCDHVIDALPRPTLLRQFLRSLRDGLPFVLVVYGVRLLLNDLPNAFFFRRDAGTLPPAVLERLYGPDDPWYTAITLGDVLGLAFVLAAAFALCAVPSPDPDRPHTTTRKVVGVLLYLFIFAVLLALHWLLPHELCRIHLLAVLAMLLALFGLWKLLDAKLD